MTTNELLQLLNQLMKAADNAAVGIRETMAGMRGTDKEKEQVTNMKITGSGDIIGTGIDARLLDDFMKRVKSGEYELMGTDRIFKMSTLNADDSDGGIEYTFNIKHAKLYNVRVPQIDDYWYIKDPDSSTGVGFTGSDCLDDEESLFTMAEIKKYGLERFARFEA